MCFPPPFLLPLRTAHLRIRLGLGWTRVGGIVASAVRALHAPPQASIASVALAQPVYPQPIDPNSGAFKSERLVYLKGTPMLHLSVLKDMRTAVAATVRHRVSRRVAMGRLSKRGGDTALKGLLSRLAKPVSMALTRCGGRAPFKVT